MVFVSFYRLNKLNLLIWESSGKKFWKTVSKNRQVQAYMFSWPMQSTAALVTDKKRWLSVVKAMETKYFLFQLWFNLHLLMITESFTKHWKDAMFYLIFFLHSTNTIHSVNLPPLFIGGWDFRKIIGEEDQDFLVKRGVVHIEVLSIEGEISNVFH